MSGPISSIMAKGDIKAGEEIYMDYKYLPNEFPFDHLWYHEMKENYLKELEEEEKQQQTRKEL